MRRNIFIIMALLTVLTFAGCASRDIYNEDSVKPVVEVAFHLVEEQSQAGLLQKTDPKTGQQIWLQPEPILNNFSIKDTRLTTLPPFDKPAVHASLGMMAQKRFANFTASHISRFVAILIDGEIVNMVQIRERIAGGNILISGDFSKKEAKRIARGVIAYQ